MSTLDGSIREGEKVHPDFSGYFLPDDILQELKQAVRGQVYSRKNSKDFKFYTQIFNGNVVTPAKAVVLPVDAQDVSSIIKLCTKHDLYPSIKAGGYGTAGHSICGDIVLDLRKLDGVEIEPPQFSGGFISLKDMPPPITKGKGKLLPDSVPPIPGVITGNISNPIEPFPDGSSRPASSSGSLKRSRSPLSQYPHDYGLPRNQVVGALLNYDETEKLPPNSRRRFDHDLDVAPLGDSMSRQSSSGSDNSKESTSTLETSMSTHNDGDSAFDPASTGYAALGIPTTNPAQSTSIPPILDPSTTRRLASDHDQQRILQGGQSPPQSASGSTRMIDAVSSLYAGPQGPEGHSNIFSGRDALQNVPRNTPTNASGEGESTSGTTSSIAGGLRSDNPFSYLDTPSGSSTAMHRSLYAQPMFNPPMSSMQRFAQSIAGPSHSPFGSMPFNMPGSLSGPSAFIASAANPVHPHAFVTIGAGVKQRDIDMYSHENPLPAVDLNGNAGHIPYHVPLAAHPVGSSVLLLGGFGFLSRLHGLSSDALVEAEVVLADGRIVIVNEKEHEDLWWALRGAGAAFGVVTRYKVKAFPVPVVFAGNLIYNFHAATAVSLVKHFRDCVKAAPRELYANVLFTAGPTGKGSLVVVQICYIGPREKGREYLEAIASWDGEPCILNEVSEKTFLHQQDSVAQILRGKSGRQWFIRSALITSLPDEVIHKTVDDFADTPVGCTWLFELAGGAVSDAEDTCLPKKQREASFTLAAFHQWELEDDDPRCVSTAERWIHNTLAPVSIGGAIPAFLGRSEYPARVKASFGENWDRLVDVKRKYDPMCLFKNSFWPVNKEDETIEPSTHQPPSP